MTTFGVDTVTGFNAMTLRDILAEIEGDELAALGPLVDVSADQPLGQLNGIYARQLAKLWEVASVAYNGFDRDKASGDQLTGLGKLTGTPRSPATYSTVICTCTLVSGTVLQSGVNFVQLAGNPAVRFTPVKDYTAASTAALPVPFRAENAGPVAAPSGQLTVISTPVVGWTVVTNPLDAALGIAADDDPTLRAKQENDLQATGTATIDGIRDNLLKLAQGSAPLVLQLQSVSMLENTSTVTNFDGLPAHTFEAIVYDGTSPDAGNANHYAQVIWDSKPAGIRPVGTSSGTAVDKLGANHTVAFTRVTASNIYVIFQLSTDSTYVGNSQFQIALAALANAAINASGQKVVAERLRALAMSITGVTDILSMTLGTAPAPAGTANITIAKTQIARFDSSRVSNI